MRRASFDGFYNWIASNGANYISTWKNWAAIKKSADKAHLLFTDGGARLQWGQEATENRQPATASHQRPILRGGMPHGHLNIGAVCLHCQLQWLAIGHPNRRGCTENGLSRLFTRPSEQIFGLGTPLAQRIYSNGDTFGSGWPAVPTVIQ